MRYLLALVLTAAACSPATLPDAGTEPPDLATGQADALPAVVADMAAAPGSDMAMGEPADLADAPIVDLYAPADLAPMGDMTCGIMGAACCAADACPELFTVCHSGKCVQCGIKGKPCCLKSKEKVSCSGEPVIKCSGDASVSPGCW